MTNTIKEQLEKEGFIIKDFKGTSMYPLFNEEEDLVYIKKIEDDIKINDIVLFLRDNDDNKYVLHRVIDIKRNHYVVCGDNQKTKEIIFNKQILGKVIGYYKKGKYISLQDKEYKDYLNTLELNLSKRKILNPLNRNQKDFLSLIRSTITSKKCNQENYNFRKIYDIAKKQRLSAFIYKAIDEKFCPKEIYEKFKIDFFENINRNILLSKEKEEFIEELNKEKINFLTIKGDEIDKLYPTPGTRFFADVDFLIKNNISKVKEIVINKGYEINKNHSLDLECKKSPIYNFEFHAKLFVKKDKIQKYFDDIFNRAIKISDCEYKMNNEDLLAYYFAHFNTHFSYGVGLRFYIDSYYATNKIEHNKEKLESILKQIEIYDFYLYISKIIKELFVDDSELLFDNNNIFINNIYGNIMIGTKKEIKEIGRLKYIIKKLFPPKEITYQYMPIVYEYPILLPIGWIYRLICKTIDKDQRSRIKPIIKCLFSSNQ